MHYRVYSSLLLHPGCWFSRLGQPDTPEHQTHFISPHSSASHWSDEINTPLLLATRRVYPAIRSRQTSHTKKPQSGANIPLLTQAKDGKLSTYQPASIHFTTCDRVRAMVGTNCPFYIPERERDDVVMMMLGELHMGKASTHS